MKKPVIHHYSTSLGGGAGLACIRGIQHAEELKAFDQKVFTLDPKNRKFNIQVISKSFFEKLKIFLNKILGRLFVIRNKQYEVFDFGDGFYSQNEVSDITHIHWVSQFLKIDSFIQSNGRYVWSLHDLAPLTGGCHYFWNCSGYQKDCSDCPQTRLNSLHQRPSKNLLNKIDVFKKSNSKLKIIATSEYSYQAAQKSAFVKSTEQIEVVKIPYGIDTELFISHDKEEVRKELGLDPKKFTICIGAENLKSYRKGGDLFSSILKKLADLKLDIQVVTFGSGDFSSLNLPFQVYPMGTTFVETEVAKIYSSANLFLALSRQEAFGQTAQEALSCGTPVICFENTGFADQVDHEKNGYIVPMENIDIVVQKICELESSKAKQESFQTHAREHIINHFEKSKIAKKYAELYQELLK